MLFEYETQICSETFGEGSRRVILEIECLKNLERTIDRMFEFLKAEGKEKSLEEVCPYFGNIWPSARVLTQVMAGMSLEKLYKKRVLELGCGLALPSLIAAHAGAKVTATDSHPDVEEFLQKNIARNKIDSTRIQYHPLDWSLGLPELGKFDYVIASDILYDKELPEISAKAAAHYCALDGKVILTDPARPYLQAFIDAMKARGFKSETQVRDEVYVVTFSK